MSRFDYVQYNAVTADAQAQIKAKFQEVEGLCEKMLPNGRAKSLVMTKLEESYMWTGKGLRDQQIASNGTAPLQEGRENS